MRANSLMIAGAAIALGASFGALAQQQLAPVTTDETIYVTAPRDYISERDALLLDDARRALDSDTATSSALLSLTANNGELSVIGTTMDVAQSTRVVTKLNALPGATKVHSFIEPMTGDSAE